MEKLKALTAQQGQTFTIYFLFSLSLSLSLSLIQTQPYAGYILIMELWKGLPKEMKFSVSNEKEREVGNQC